MMVGRFESQPQMVKMAAEVINMRYWCTFDSISKRIIRFSADLSTAMRTFCYSFAFALILKNSGEIKIGKFLLNEDGVGRLSLPVGIFIMFDLLHPLLTLIALHLMGGARFMSLKRYEGKGLEPYTESLDKTEIIYELHPLEIFGTSIMPTLLLGSKVIIVLWAIIEIILHFKIGA
jgi:hypothetical protein